MASHRPVVGTEVEGMRELLGPGVKEQTVPYGDTQVLADRIVRFMQDPALAASTGEENRRRAGENLRNLTDGKNLRRTLVFPRKRSLVTVHGDCPPSADKGTGIIYGLKRAEN